MSKDLYLLLRDNFHYTKALETRFDDRIGLERIVQHIGVGYLHGFEELDDEKSLTNQLFAKKNPEQLSALVDFFWRLGDKLTEELKRKIKPLWARLFEISSENEKNPEFHRVMSNLSKWLTLIDELDDQSVEWLKLSAKYIRDVERIFFVEYLLKHVSKAPDKVGEIYLAMLNSGIFPSHEQGNIKELVRILYERGQREAADRICNLYLDKGFYFLTTVYEGYRCS